MTTSEKELGMQACFGDLNTVFPMGDDGLRGTPDDCMACDRKTECLRTAMKRPTGIDVREEMVDRAFTAGRLGFFQRWSRRKAFSRQRSRMKKEQG